MTKELKDENNIPMLMTIKQACARYNIGRTFFDELRTLGAQAENFPPVYKLSHKMIRLPVKEWDNFMLNGGLTEFINMYCK